MGSHKEKFQFPEKMYDVDPVTGKLIALPLFVKPNTDKHKEMPKITSLPLETKAPLEPLDFKTLFAENTKISSQRSETKSPLKPLDFKKLFAENSKNTRQSTQTKRQPESKLETHNRTKKLKFSENIFDVPKVSSMSSETKVPLEPLDLKKLITGNSKITRQSSQAISRPEASRFRYTLSDANEASSKIRNLYTTPHSARRLFPSKKYQNSRLSRSRNSTSLTTMSKMIKSKIDSTKSSPLLNLEEVEQNLLSNRSTLRNYQFKSPDMPSFKFTKLTNSQGKSKKLQVPQIILEESENFTDQIDEAMEQEGEPRTPDSTQEFNNLEQLCKDSPVTSVCNLMQETMIGSAKRKKGNLGPNSDLAKHIETLMREEKMRHKKLIQEEEIRHKTLIEQEEIRHEQNISMLNTILTTIGEFTETEKENESTKTNRRSERLLKKSPMIQKEKLLTSPAILKSGDLRKSTLKKNFAARSIDYQIVSNSRAQKAMELYNSLTSRSEFLETPKSDRKNLSARLQDQCFLLQDTPVHK